MASFQFMFSFICVLLKYFYLHNFLSFHHAVCLLSLQPEDYDTFVSAVIDDKVNYTVTLLKELRRRSCIKIFKTNWLNFSKSSFSIRFNPLHPQLSLFLFALEWSLWCFSSLANHYFKVSSTWTAIYLGHQRNDSKYRDVAPSMLSLRFSEQTTFLFSLFKALELGG